MFTDFMGSFYIDLGSSTSSVSGEMGGVSGDAFVDASGEAPAGGSQIAWEGEAGEQNAFTANDYLSVTQYTEISSDRLRSEMEIFIPTAYETWSFDDENYGPTAEEYASLGIDLDAWYAANE